MCIQKVKLLTYSKNGYIQCKKLLKLALLGGKNFLPSAKNKRKLLTFTSFEHAIVSPFPPSPQFHAQWIFIFSRLIDEQTTSIEPYICFPIYHFRLTLSLEHSHSFFLKLKCITFSNVDYFGRSFVQFNSKFEAKTLTWVLKPNIVYRGWEGHRPPSWLIINIDNPKTNEKKNTHAH
jgi:hypothetical protein